MHESSVHTDPHWLTTVDVARMIEHRPWYVCWLARTGRLPSDRTHSGQYLFRKRDVHRYMETRATAKLRGVYVGRPKRLGVPNEPHQMSLPWHGPRAVPQRQAVRAELRLVDRADRNSSHDPVSDHAECLKESA